MSIRVAPSWREAALRTAIILVCVLAVATTTYALEGAPQHTRELHLNEVAGYAAHLRGLQQLVPQLIALVLLAWVARRVLRVRL